MLVYAHKNLLKKCLKQINLIQVLKIYVENKKDNILNDYNFNDTVKASTDNLRESYKDKKECTTTKKK